MNSEFKPKNILPNASLTLRSSLCDQVQELLHTVKTKLSYRVYVVAQRRGMCYHNDRVITIPKWVCTSELQNKRQWYVSHEIAHAFTHELYDSNKVPSHGSEFMGQLKLICPPEYLHFEAVYKPKNAALAGISQNMHINNMLAGVMPKDF